MAIEELIDYTVDGVIDEQLQDQACDTSSQITVNLLMVFG